MPDHNPERSEDQLFALAESMDEFQELVGLWASAQFNTADWRSILCHLADEVVELCGQAIVYEALFNTQDKYDKTTGVIYERDVQTEPADDESREKESADVVLLLLHLAHRDGFKLLRAVALKHGINTRRLWGKPDERGVSYHIDRS